VENSRRRSHGDAFISFIFLAKVGAEINGNPERKLPRKKKTEDFFQERGYEKLHGKKKRFLDGHVYGLLWSTDSAL